MSKTKAKALAMENVFEKVISLQRAKSFEAIKPYQEMSDEELVKAIQIGEEEAYSHIVQRYQGRIYAYVMRLINNREEAHDITQDVFLKAYKNLHSFETDRKFSSWIYRIAHNESVNWLKKTTKVKVESLEVREENGHQVAAVNDVQAEYERNEEQKVVRRAIDELPDKYREVMELRYLKQLSYEEISGSLKKPINTVGTLINRAKKRLAANLAKG